jgi:intergrase/recombinase
VIDWDYIERAIYANYSRNWARWCLSLMRRYYHILLSSDASELMLLKPRIRIDAMKALSMLAKVTGLNERWKAIREAYGLKWSQEISYVPSILTSQTYSSLIDKARKVISSSNRYRGVLEFIALSGLRVGEALDAMRLYHNDAKNYLNRELMVLEHFKYPAIFIRKTKKAYITVLDDYMLDLLEDSKPVTYNALSLSIKRRFGTDHCPSMFRKIWATYMRNHGLESEIVDLLQGRTPKSIFLRHYYRPDMKPLIEKVRENLEEMRKELGIDGKADTYPTIQGLREVSTPSRSSYGYHNSLSSQPDEP